MTLAMFVTYVRAGNTLTSEKVFTVIGIFMSARVVMTIFVPSSIMFLKEGGVSMKRIQVLYVCVGMSSSMSKSAPNVKIFLASLERTFKIIKFCVKVLLENDRVCV